MRRAKRNVAPAEAKHPKPQTNAKEDWKSLPLAEVEKSRDHRERSHSGRGDKRLTQYGPNEIPEKNQSASQVSHIFLGSDPVDDRSGRGPFGGRPTLAGLWHHLRPARRQQRGRVLGGTPGRQRHRRAECQAGGQRRVQRDGKWTTPPARELVPGDVIRLRLGDIVPADARLLEGDPSRWTNRR